MTDDTPPQKIPLIFFRTGAGGEPVREWLKGLVETERQALGKDLLRAQWQWPVGMPLCRPLGDGPWEVRTDFADEVHGAGAALPLPRAPRRTARVYQENACDAA